MIKRNGEISMKDIELGAKQDILSRIVHELCGLWRDIGYMATFISYSDKCALFFAILMLLGVYMPWVSAAGFFTQTGLMGGGDLHFVLALVTLFHVKKVAHCQ